MDKKALRKALLDERKAMDYMLKHQLDGDIFNRLIALPQFKSAKCVLVYFSLSFEVSTLNIINYCLENEKELALPVIRNGKMTFHRITSGTQVVMGNMNIYEPVEGSPQIVEFKDSVCLVPGLAFSENGFRIGFGGGYYDRFLDGFGGISIGLVYEDFIREIPIEKHDIAVNFLITGKRIQYGQ